MTVSQAKVNDNDKNRIVTTLKFCSYEDMQCRLQMIPLDNELGLGACILAYQPDVALTSLVEENYSSSNSSNSNSNHQNNYNRNVICEEDLQGFELVEILGKEKNVQDWRSVDFATILEVCRACFDTDDGRNNGCNNSPRNENDKKNDDEENGDLDESENDIHGDPKSYPLCISFQSPNSSSPSTLQESTGNATKNELANKLFDEAINIKQSLNIWSAAVRVTGEQIAAKAVKKVEEAKIHHKQQQQEKQRTLSYSEEKNNNNGFEVFIQSKDGEFEPITREDTEITNMSILQVKENSLKPLLTTSKIIYCWQRSHNAHDCEMEDWSSILGAEHSMYQPSALDVGSTLRVVITGKGTNELIFESTALGPVLADKNLFDAARKSLLERGAHFSGLEGSGSATNRYFSVMIERKSLETEPNRVTCITNIYQKDGDTLERMSDPLEGVFPCDCENSKSIKLMLPQSITNTMIGFLAKNFILELKTPSRITREAILMALGIASAQSDLHQLSRSTCLYSDFFTGKSRDEKIEAIDAEAQEASTPGKTTKSNTKENRIHTPDVQEMEKETRNDGVNESDVNKLLDYQYRAELTEHKLQNTETLLEKSKNDVKQFQKENQKLISSLKTCEKDLRIKNENIQLLNATIEDKDMCIKQMNEQIVLLEKQSQVLRNEKSVLIAQVETGYSKLEKMSSLEKEIASLNKQLQEAGKAEQRMCVLEEKLKHTETKLNSMALLEDELAIVQNNLRLANETIHNERKVRIETETKLEGLRALQTECNKYKKRSESLSKELNRVCRNGRSLQDVERILANQDAMSTEISILKDQKSAALRDLEKAQSYCNELIASQSNEGCLDLDAMRALQQKSELERIISSLTETLDAKEMQLNSLKEVNSILIQQLADEKNQ